MRAGHVLHAQCAVEGLARVAAPPPLSFWKDGCRTWYSQREALEAAVQADAGLCSQAARMGGGSPATVTGAVKGYGTSRTRTAWSLGRHLMLSSSRTCSSAWRQYKLYSGGYSRPRSTACPRDQYLQPCPGGHRPNRTRCLSSWHILPSLLYLPDGRVKNTSGSRRYSAAPSPFYPHVSVHETSTQVAHGCCARDLGGDQL